MNRKLSLLGISLSTLLFVLVSCSSGNKEDADGTSSDIAEATTDANDQAMTDAATGDISQDPALSDDGSQMAENKPADDNFKSEASAESEFTAEGAPQDIPPADPLAETPPPADGAAPADPLAETPPPADGATPPAPAPEVAQNDAAATPPSDQSAGDLFGSTAATTEPSSSEPASGGFDAPAEPKPKKSGLAHIKLKPFKRGGQLLNTVYLAREGDTLETISEKLFAANKVKDLKKANPALKGGVKTGDKVYFNSPNRPEDNEKMMTVYEDQGLPPSTYVSKEGDTLKSLAMEWYGSEGSYKEIYAINHNLTSTKSLPPESEIVYWPATASVIAYNTAKEEPVAQNTLPPPPEAPAPATAVMPPMPPPAPAQDPAAMAQANNMAPPPPMPDLNAPPLPPPPSTVKKKSGAPELDKDAIFMIGGIAALLICGGALVAIRKKGGRRNQGVTQI